MNTVAILTKDFEVKQLMASDFRRDVEYELMITALNVIQIMPLLKRAKNPILLIDIEHFFYSNDQILRMEKEYNVPIVCFGTYMSTFWKQSKIPIIVSKPISGSAASAAVFIQEVKRNIRIKSSKYVAQTGFTPASSVPSSNSASSFALGNVLKGDRLIVIASSTGGPDALPVVSKDLPANSPPILIVQHMPAAFTKQFAERLDKLSNITVREAKNGEYLTKGTALLAPGDFHMKLVSRMSKLAVECFMSDKMHGVRPAADILFRSVAELQGGTKVIGVILTGMGGDGARGLLELKSRGASTIGQDKESCVVYGMPKVAYDIGAVQYQLPLNKIADKIISLY